VFADFKNNYTVNFTCSIYVVQMSIKAIKQVYIPLKLCITFTQVECFLAPI
jgi:hypothetical protein